MPKVSDLEKKFKEQTQQQQKIISEIGSDAFNIIASDWKKLLDENASTLSSVIKKQNSDLAQQMEGDKRRLSAFFRFNLWLAVLALLLLMVATLGWLWFGKTVLNQLSMHSLKNVEIKVGCNYDMGAICATGTVLEYDPETEEAYIVIKRN